MPSPFPAGGVSRVFAMTRRASASCLIPATICPDCGGPLRLLGEDLSRDPGFRRGQAQGDGDSAAEEVLPAVREDRAAPAPASDPGGMAGRPVAYILVSKFDDHLPLYRQGEIFARHGRRHSRGPP